MLGRSRVIRGSSRPIKVVAGPSGHRRAGSTGSGSYGSSESSFSDSDDTLTPEGKKLALIDKTIELLHQKLVDCLNFLKPSYEGRVSYTHQQHPVVGLKKIIEYQKNDSGIDVSRDDTCDNLIEELTTFQSLDKNITVEMRRLNELREAVSLRRAQLSLYQSASTFLGNNNSVKLQKIEEVKIEIERLGQEDCDCEARIIQLRQERINLMFNVLSGLRNLWPVELASVSLDSFTSSADHDPHQADETTSPVGSSPTSRMEIDEPPGPGPSSFTNQS